MIQIDGARKTLTEMWGRLTRPHSFPLLDAGMKWVGGLSPGDRIIFYGLGVLLSVAALAGLYTLEKSLLVEVPAYGGTLIEGEIGSPRFINPLLAITDADRDLATLTYAGLMGLTGEGELTPVLAGSYEISPDGKSYTFVLRDNARFSDGTAVTAADVVFTVQKAQDPGLKSPVYGNWSGVGVEALDARTVRFMLSKPYAPFLQLTTLGILPAHLWQNISDEEFPFSTLNTSPIGAGPFRVSNISRDASGLIQSVTLSYNPRYPLGRPYLDGIRFIFYPNADDLARAYTSGVVESAYGVSTPEVQSAPYARVFGVFFNQNEKQVFTRSEVRKALSLAINRETIVEEALGGYAQAIMGPVPPGGRVSPTMPPVSENPTADAATVLQGAGWKYDADARAWKHAGAKQTLDAITIRTSNVPELKRVASAVKQDWEKLGIPVDIELYEPGDLSQNVIRPRKYEALLYGMVIGRDQDLYAFWSSQERNDPGLNIALYANKTVDGLLEKVRSNSEEEERIADLEKIEKAIAAEYPAAFVYSPDFIYAVPERLKGVTLPQITTPADRFAAVATWYRSTDAVWPFLASGF